MKTSIAENNKSDDYIAFVNAYSACRQQMAKAVTKMAMTLAEAQQTLFRKRSWLGFATNSKSKTMDHQSSRHRSALRFECPQARSADR
jgi:hypothetical protein